MDPEDEGGYITWHRDMPDIQSASCLFPTDRLVKVVIYLHDCEVGRPEDCAPTSFIPGSHLLPFDPEDVYGQQFYDRSEAKRGVAIPQENVPNVFRFAPRAGWAAMFDQTTWHTGLPNRSGCPRRGNIVQYMRSPIFSTADAFTGLSKEDLDVLAPHMSERQKQLLGCAAL